MERCINSLVSGLAARSVIVEHQDIHGEVFGTDTEKELADVFAQWCETMMKRCGEEQKKTGRGGESHRFCTELYSGKLQQGGFVRRIPCQTGGFITGLLWKTVL